MARSASAASVISTNANPRDRPVSRSVTRLTRSMFPYGANSSRIEDSVAAKSKLPTKMFFTLLLLCCFSGEGEAHRIARLLHEELQNDCTMPLHKEALNCGSHN